MVCVHIIFQLLRTWGKTVILETDAISAIDVSNLAKPAPGNQK